MRIAAHAATLAALIALSAGFGRWLREPGIGGLLFLLALAAPAALAIRQLHRRPSAPAAAPDAPPRPEPDPPLPGDRVDLNTAGVAELQRLPGVGPVAAQRIVADREANGPFASVEDLARVPGFGAAKVRVLAPEARTS